MSKANQGKRSQNRNYHDTNAEMTSSREDRSCSRSKKSSRSNKQRRSTGSSRRPYNAVADNASTNDALRGVNDMSWYNQYPALIQTAASFPYPYRPGMTIDFGTAAIQATASTTKTVPVAHQIPGVLVLEWYPSVGQSLYPTDPASIAGKEMYARVRKVYSGAIDADAPDFVMYTLALDSVFAYCAWLKRLYRALNAWTPDNYALPDALLMAFGLSQSEITSLREDRANLLHCINELILQSQKFRCPAIMDIFNRHYWMSDNIYLDAPSIASQIYAFNPQGLYILNAQQKVAIAGSADTAAGLSISPMPTVSADVDVSVSSLFNYGLSLIQALDEWDDSYLISGYLMRAYEGVPSFKVDLLTIDEQLTPLYVEEVLMQIENSRTAATLVYAGNMGVFQNPLTNAVVSQPICAPRKTTANGINLNLPGTISVRSDSPTLTDNVIATRLQTLTSADTITPIVVDTAIGGDAPLTQGNKIICGTELVLSMKIFDLNRSSLLTQHRLYSVVGVSIDNMDAAEWENLPYYFELAEFDWHPITWIVYYRSGAVTNTDTFCNGDIHNFTLVSEQQFEVLNRTCLFSEFRSFDQQ
nr:capsid protein [Rat picobirnavirus]